MVVLFFFKHLDSYNLETSSQSYNFTRVSEDPTILFLFPEKKADIYITLLRQKLEEPKIKEKTEASIKHVLQVNMGEREKERGRVREKERTSPS